MTPKLYIKQWQIPILFTSRTGVHCKMQLAAALEAASAI